MDYKEKYEMALEGIQEILGSGEDSIKMSRLQLRLQGIFPELAESEDERIRKSIIELLNEVHFTFKYYDINKMLAWLEKQGEQKSAWSEEDEKKRKCLIKGLEDRMGFGWASDPFSREEYINWLKSLRPQNTWKPSDKQMKQLGWIAEQNKDNMIGKELMSLYQDLLKLKE